MKRKILILGGFGFMGKNANIIFANDNKYEIINESRRTNCDITNLFQFKSKIKDINPDIIIHAAANVGSLNYLTTFAADVIHDNSQLYLNLYKAVSEINTKILIINPLSNCSYPSIANIQNEELWWNGPMHKSIESFGEPKKLGFIVSECYRKQYQIKTLNFILPNSYGENDYINSEKTHAMNGIIMRMIQAMKNKDKEFIIWGTGTPIREWLYMPDACKLFKYVIDNEYYDLPNPINIGQEKGISIIDTTLIVKKLLNYDVKIIFDSTKQDGEPIKILGSKLFKQHFPNFKLTNYEEGIMNTIRYYKKII
jgi:GDP-L-fucose synthase